MKMLVGIPAYNEETMVGKVVKSIPKKLYGASHVEIVVIDDGSNDHTFIEARKAGAKVFQHLINRGLGGALKTIFAYARETECDILVTFDADGQHDSSDLSKIVAPVIKNKSDVVIGSRWLLKKDAPFLRKMVNKLANFVTFIFFDISTSDSQSGFRAFGKKAINSIILTSDGMEVSSEVFKEVKRNRLRLAEIPIKPVYTRYSRAKGQKLSNSINVFIQLLLRLLQ